MSNDGAQLERLALQPLNVDDHLDDFHQIMSNTKAISFSGLQPSKGTSATEILMLRFIPSDEKPWVENYAILLRESLNSAESGKPRMIGTIGATRVLPDEDAIELSYGLHPDFWGRGYMREALGKFIKLYWAPNREEVRPVMIAKVDPENIASWKVLEKLGFQKGEVLDDVYQRGSVDETQKRDQIKWYLRRYV